MAEKGEIKESDIKKYQFIKNPLVTITLIFCIIIFYIFKDWFSFYFLIITSIICWLYLIAMHRTVKGNPNLKNSEK